MFSKSKIIQNTLVKSNQKINLLFISLLLLEFCCLLYLIVQHRIPGGLDGFQYFIIQYYFLNDKIFSGETPQWMQYMTHGTVATWWYVHQAGIFQNVLLQISGFISPLLKSTNFAIIFNIGIFIDELILLSGSWLLAKRFFKSPLTVFFVTLTVIGSCIWMLQPWFNFHLYYTLPLILHFGHKFLDTGKWRYLFLSGNLLAFQIFGNAPYLLAVLSLTVFLYFAFYFLFNFHDIRRRFSDVRINGQMLCALTLLILIFYLAYQSVSIHTDQIAKYNYGREASSQNSLAGFLSYGKNLSPAKWAELVFGYSPFLDQNLFIGLLPLPLILIGLLFNTRRGNRHFLAVIAVLFLTSAGTAVAALFYFIWPMMKYYRHLSLISPLIKIFICFLSGFGLDVLLNPAPGHVKESHFKNILTVCSLLLFGAALLQWTIARDADLAENIYKTIVQATTIQKDVNADTPRFQLGLPHIIDKNLITARMKNSAVFSFLTSILLTLFINIKDRPYRRLLIYLILFLHAVNLYGYKIFEINRKTVPLNTDSYSTTRFQKMPYIKRRDRAFSLDRPRDKIFYSLTYDPTYWSTYIFLFRDEIGHLGRTDHCLKPLDRYMRAYWGQPVNDSSATPKGLIPFNRLIFPLTHPASGKIAGLTEDKIQFFSNAYTVGSEKEMASLMTDPRYKGDVLFLAPQKDTPSHAQPWTDSNDLSADQRDELKYHVDRYASNHLEISILGNKSRSGWLLYSDVWHPVWKAEVNGKPAPVYKANLAYKAIPLKPGANKILFSFHSPEVTFLYNFWGTMAVVWLIIISYLICGVIKEEHLEGI